MIAIPALKRLMLATLLLFAAIALAASYWALAGGGGILLRDDNPRLIEAVARILRGSIYDYQEQLLVESVATDGGMRRSYLRPSTFSLVGYYSLRYGSSGIEAAFDSALIGSKSTDSLETYFLREILNLPPTGADLRLTLRADIQDALALAMRGYRGAAVAMDSKTGAVLAMISLPGYDPNTLDADWERLVADEGRPFFNRTVQGLYQPGTVMTALWLAQAIESGFDLSTPFAGPDAPVELEPGLTFQCLVQPSSETISLVEASITGCPAPFVNYEATLARDSFSRLVDTFSLQEPVALAGFPLPGAGAFAATEASGDAESDVSRARDVLGQGGLTMTPLQMAAIMSAMAADGDAPTPFLLSGIRQPGADIWETQTPGQGARSMLAPASAARIRAVLQEAWKILSGNTVAVDGQVGANVAMSRSGEDTQIWLYGFVAPDERPAVAFVVVLETTDAIDALVAIGQSLTQAILSS